MNKEKLYQEALDLWGVKFQEGMLIEEIGEVLTAWNKKTRKVNGVSEIDFFRELVDLEIMLEQMKIISFKTFNWEKEKQEKLEQLAKIINVYGVKK